MKAYINAVMRLDIETCDKIYLITEFTGTTERELLKMIVDYADENIDVVRKEIAQAIAFRYIRDDYIDHTYSDTERFLNDEFFLNYIIQQFSE